ncbi:centrosomal protein of 126 kDa-like [Myxocyprinus asiaticus]|uniref:centrosomal protein of 126 kDa-like n=1 Tax=Myxocyprinus asiaticus TaxID=70543 RepID=UPI0022234CDC|nr:centrosomal protein of 126 kDa-like [Myxocyprinus asiaticus]
MVFGMLALKDTLYYSNITGGQTEDERDLLVQEQRYCRAQARKLSLETNRRRKALEERRKQWDVQEQRSRENVLQQRRQRVQDATENFQRAHLPLSQRKRPAFNRRTLNLDEALHHIQGTPHLYAQQSPFLFSASTINRSCIPSPNPPGGAHHLRALSAAETYAKLMQEKSLSNFKNQLLLLNEQQEAQAVLKEKEQFNSQEYPDTPHSETESLSSLDSLENGDPQQSHGTKSVSCSNLVCCSHQSTNCAQSSYSLMDPPKFQDPKTPPLPQRQSKNLCSLPNPSCSAAKSFQVEVLSHEGKPRDHESAEESGSLENLTQATEQCNLKDQTQSFNTQCTLSCKKELTQQDLLANSEHMTHHNDKNAQGIVLKDKASVVAHCKTQTVPDTTPLESSSLTKELKSESNQQTRTLEEKHARHSSERQTALPASRCKNSDSVFEVFSSAAAGVSIISQTDPSSRNSDIQPIEMLSFSKSHEHKPDVDNATGPKRESKPLSTEKSIRIDLLDPKNETDITKLARARMSKSSRNTEEPDRTSAEPVTHVPNSSNVRFLKGILKNHLKSGNVKFTYTPGHVLFTKEVAILIRDSVELARAKLKEPEQNRTVKKKLRWFDEVNGIEGVDVDRVCKDPSKHAVAKSMHANLHQQTHKYPSADLQQGLHNSDYVNLLTGVSKNISNKSFTAPAEPQSSRQAWADVGPQKNSIQEHIREPTSQRGGLYVGGPRTPRRVRSARVSSVPITSRARKGTIIRPQSAREAQHVAKTQGNILVPRPPPKPEVMECDLAESPMYNPKAAYCDDGVQSKPDQAVELALYKDNPDSQTMAHRPILKTEKDALCAPEAPHYTYIHQTGSKGIYYLSPADALADNWMRSCGENGICLDRTPTDEEITLLWHGVRSALASKDGDPQSFLTNNGPLSASPQACASLSHVTINGDSLISGVNGVSRMVRNPLRRQTMEGNMVKNRVSVESSRNQTAGTVQRKPSFPYQVNVPKTSHPNRNGHAADSEDVTDGGHDTLDLSQSHQNSTVPQSQGTKSLSVSALSLEEQKILQSLDRLNQRLQYVQDTVGGNTTVKGMFALAPAYNQTGDSVGVTMRRRGFSADNRTRTQHRY